jgi:beta-N-acetylhexosaminidase
VATRTPVSSPVDLGLRFIVEPSGVVLTPNEAAALAELRPSGVMLRKRNFLQNAPYREWLTAYRTLLSDVRAAIGRDSIVVCIDHEGGNVVRFPPPITRFPYPALYAASDAAVREVSLMMAAELRSLGINVSFSPVADVHSNPANPVINERAFGRTAEQVAHAAGICAQALREGGVVPCAKHFPGHGDTSSDSHYALPVVSASREELESRELAPFRALIKAGIEMIMSAHIVVPALDPQAQATLSSVIMKSVLRDELSFTGITIADALGMKAIHEAISLGSFGMRAHTAGIDLLLMVGDTVSIADAVQVRDEWSRELDSLGGETLASLQNVEQRLSSFLATLPQYAVTELDAKTLSEHAALAAELAKNAPWGTFQFNPVGFD